jgi:uncharacterized protein YciI
MLFMVVGYLRAGSDAQLVEFRDEFNEHLSQRSPNIASAGVLRDKEARRRGYLAFVEADRIEDAELFLQRSPFLQEDLYERVDVLRYDVEIGNVGS